MPALKPNGILIYMTCSFSTAENEDICDEIVEQFSAESITLEVPTDWGILKTISKKKQASAYLQHCAAGIGDNQILADDKNQTKLWDC